jgi:branched-chain amino acid transport system ATP-binding protein
VSNLLEIKGLTSSYGKMEAIRDICISLPSGAAATIIGPNGAGKSTLLNSIIGLQPSSGEVWFAEERIDMLSAEDRLERGLCLISEKRELFSTMSVEDNLLLGAYTRRSQGVRSMRKSMQTVFDQFPRLQERRAQLAGTLSGGERQMLAIGRALMSKPVLLMMDEPSLGLAPRIVQETFAQIVDLRNKGMSLLLVEQNARAALNAAEYGYVLEMGSIVLEGSSRDLINHPNLASAYFGGNDSAA